MEGESPGQSDTVVRLLDRVRSGDASASRELLPVIYEELRVIAQSVFRKQDAGHTLQPTVLVHDAFVRLVQSDLDLDNSRHFYAVAAKAMRQILTDHARARHAQKRGGDWARVTITDKAMSGGTFGDMDVLDLEEALEALAAMNPRHAQLVELRFYGGLSIEEAAEELQVSRQTAVNDWTMARAWLRKELTRGGEA
jgi:RNA polymerase sigma factor (TIGR02999 family)